MLTLVLVIGGQQDSSAGLFKKLAIIFNNNAATNWMEPIQRTFAKKQIFAIKD